MIPTATICKWCERKPKNSAGQWVAMDVEEYLQITSGKGPGISASEALANSLNISHGMCPECEVKMNRELDAQRSN